MKIYFFNNVKCINNYSNYFQLYPEITFLLLCEFHMTSRNGSRKHNCVVSFTAVTIYFMQSKTITEMGFHIKFTYNSGYKRTKSVDDGMT